MEEVVAFAGVAALIVVVPGPDMALVLRNGVAYGRHAAVATALRINADGARRPARARAQIAR
jgi:threonine/homoserine/homoserine lactone efflux protein